MHVPPKHMRYSYRLQVEDVLFCIVVHREHSAYEDMAKVASSTDDILYMYAISIR